ncbi:MAG: uroporphyrinogen decarboxylase family protein [Gemmatimonadota bacterium]
MNTRERFVRALQGKPVDRVPFIKVFGGTNAVLPHWEEEHPGIGGCIDELLGFEGTYRGWGITPVRMDATRLDPVEVLAETEEIATQRLGDGTVVQIYKHGDYHRHAIEWPVKGPRDWERYRERHLDPDDPVRFPPDWEQRVQEYRQRDYPLQLTHRGVYGFARERLGDVALALAFYDDPALVHEIVETYTDLALALWEKQVRAVDFDLIECWEDMASKNGSMVSPATFRQFLAPAYRRIAAFARDHGIPVILVDSDGLIEELTGLMVEAGVTAMYPYEVLAGNDVARVLDTHPGVGVIGGLRKECMYEGREAIDREMEKARYLIRRGRFIPGPDHFALRQASFASYRYFMERLREVVMTTEPGR